MRVNLIMAAFDNEIVCAHINQMAHAIFDVSASPYRLLTSDRPVHLFNLKEPNGMVWLPISPTKLFVAMNDRANFGKLESTPPRKLVASANTYVVSRARRFVWAQDISQGYDWGRNSSTGQVNRAKMRRDRQGWNEMPSCPDVDGVLVF
jgi:hypothetical protein